MAARRFEGKLRSDITIGGKQLEVRARENRVGRRIKELRSR
jgi:hypothetical protein